MTQLEAVDRFGHSLYYTFVRYAVIRTGGKQYKVSEGQQIKIEKLNSEKDKNIDFDDVLLVVDEDKVHIGQPTLNTKVKAKIIDQIRDKKIRVSTYKAKTGYHRTIGHRQNLTVVQIEKIDLPTK